ncbi:hypothetical protein [Nonomuraea deserti]|nr:hypothetical protein [Nonomuraea deserti]
MLVLVGLGLLGVGVGDVLVGVGLAVGVPVATTRFTEGPPEVGGWQW